WGQSPLSRTWVAHVRLAGKSGSVSRILCAFAIGRAPLEKNLDRQNHIGLCRRLLPHVSTAADLQGKPSSGWFLADPTRSSPRQSSTRRTRTIEPSRDIGFSANRGAADRGSSIFQIVAGLRTTPVRCAAKASPCRGAPHRSPPQGAEPIR